MKSECRYTRVNSANNALNSAKYSTHFRNLGPGNSVNLLPREKKGERTCNVVDGCHAAHVQAEEYLLHLIR